MRLGQSARACRYILGSRGRARVLLVHPRQKARPAFLVVTGLSTTDPSPPPSAKTRCTKQKWPLERPLRHPTPGWLPAVPSLPPDSERDRGQIHHPIEQGSPPPRGSWWRVAVPSAIEESPSARRHGTIGTGGSFVVVCLQPAQVWH